MENYVIGVDFGSDSCRAVVINAANGEEVSSSVFAYPRWAAGRYCEPDRNQFRQHPLDYLEGLEHTIKGSLTQAGKAVADQVRGIAIDTTGSTPAPVDKEGTLLALRPEFADNPNAMFVLWKDHTAVREAADINELAHTWGGTDYTKYCGGIYSSEWFWAKILHVYREDRAVREAAWSWVEHCDWMPAILTGHTTPAEIRRSRCAAGHKALWHREFHGLPSEEFLNRLDPLLAGLRERLFTETLTSDKQAGTLFPEWAGRLGLSEKVIVSVGAFDAHMGAAGGEISPGAMIKVIGTSTCDIMIDSVDKDSTVIKGICGQVDGSVLPGYLGLEAGQSAFGDTFAWFKRLLLWPVQYLYSQGKSGGLVSEELIKELDSRILPMIEKSAESIDPEQSGILALDWLNGRRTPDADQRLKAAIFGLNLASDAPAVYRALVESTAFGARAINDCFETQGVPVHEVIAIGGVSKKSPFAMQILADVLNKPIKVARSLQTVALGSAMFASVAAGLYPDLPAAQAAIGQGFEREYQPRPDYVRKYEVLYRQFRKAGAFVETLCHGE
jgi:L-ribulokinase